MSVELDALVDVLSSSAGKPVSVICNLTDAEIGEDSHVVIFNENGVLKHSIVMTEEECLIHLQNEKSFGTVSAVEFLTFYNMWSEKNKSVEKKPIMPIGGAGEKEIIIPDDKDVKIQIWKCSSCTFENLEIDKSCICCETPKSS